MKKFATLLTGLLVLSMSVGCARNPVGTSYDSDTYSQQEEQTSDFNNNPNSYYNDNGTTNNQTNQTSYGTQDPYATAVDALTATVSNKELPGVWLWEKVQATIMVNNAAQTAVSGVLNITFTHEGETVETQQQTVSLQAGESQQITAKSTKHADDVTVTITPNVTTSTYGQSSSYGQSSNYGQSSSYSQYGSY